MLINNSYFVGELLVASKEQAAIAARLDWFISIYEPEFLEKALGYSLYQALLAGYDGVASPDPKWTKLIQGTEYQVCGKTRKWKGLIYQVQNVLDAFDALNDEFIIVGRGQMYDPVNDTTTTVIPPQYVDVSFRFYQNTYGQLRPPGDPLAPSPYAQYTYSGNILTLLDGLKFTNNDTYFYKAAALNTTVSPGPAGKTSLIANYVYFWFMTDLHTQSTSMGETRATTENAQIADPAPKMVKAWNEMFRWLCQLTDYLDANKDVYTEWQDTNAICVRASFGRTNEYGF